MQGDANHSLDRSLRELTVNTILKRQAEVRGDKVFLRTVCGMTFTFEQVHKITNRIANWFQGQGISHGSHVGVMMENELECLFSHIALAKLGAVSVPINTSARGGMLAHYINFSDAQALITSLEYAERLIPIQDEIGDALSRLIIVGEHNLSPQQKFTVTAFSDSDQGSEADITTPVKFSDLAFIMFTSGTTGPSKGVMFSQARAFLWDEGIVPAYGVGENDP